MVSACAERDVEGSWIGTEIEIAYSHLYQLGHAHSIEVWDDETLVGGLYGVAQGALFFGESMFSRRPNASKLALGLFLPLFYASGRKNGRLPSIELAYRISLRAHNIARSDFLAMFT